MSDMHQDYNDDDYSEDDTSVAEESADVKAKIIARLANRGALPAFIDLMDSTAATEPWRKVFADYLDDRYKKHQQMDQSTKNSNHFLECETAQDSYDTIRDKFDSAGTKFPIMWNSFVKSLSDRDTYNENKEDLKLEALQALRPAYDKFVTLVQSLAMESTASASPQVDLSASTVTATTSTRTDAGADSPSSAANQAILSGLKNNDIAYGHLTWATSSSRARANRFYIDGDDSDDPRSITFAILKQKSGMKTKYVIKEHDLPEEKDREFIRKTFREFPAPQTLEFSK